MQEAFLVILDVLLIITAFVVTFNVLRLLLYIFGKNESDMSRQKAIITTVATVIIFWLMDFSAGAYLGPWTPLASLGVCIVVIKLLCWVRFWKSIFVTPVFIAVAYGTFLGLTMLGDHFFPDRRTLMGDIRNSGSVLSKMAAEGGGENEFSGKSIKEIFQMVMVGLGYYKDAAVDAAELLQDKDKVKAMTADHESDLVEVGVLSTNRFGDEIDADLDLRRADPRDVLKIVKQLAEDPSSVDPAILQALQNSGSGSGPGSNLSIEELQEAVAKLDIDTDAKGDDSAIDQMTKISGLLSGLSGSGNGKKNGKKRGKKQSAEEQQSTELLAAIALAVERDKLSSSSSGKMTISKGSRSNTRKRHVQEEDYAPDVDEEPAEADTYSESFEQVEEVVTAVAPVETSPQVAQVAEPAAPKRRLTMEEKHRELHGDRPMPGDVVDGWQYLSKEEYSTDWEDAQDEIALGSTMQRQGTWMVIINNEMMKAGDTVSVDYEGQTYHFRLAEVSATKVVCDPVRSPGYDEVE